MRGYRRTAHAILDDGDPAEGSFDDTCKLDVVLMAVGFGVSEDNIWTQIQSRNQILDLGDGVPVTTKLPVRQT